jgi:hypothetical protein
MRMILIANAISGVLVVCGCSPTVQEANEATAASSAPADAPAPASPPAPPAEPQPAVDEAAAGGGRETIVARVAEAGPRGGGRCVQRSYRIERIDAPGGAPLWVHFESCEGAPPPSFDGASLNVGETYRFELEQGRSSSFPGAPMILGVSAP